MDDKLFDIFQKRQLYRNVYWIELMRHWTRWRGQKIKRKKQEAQGDEPTGKTGSAAWSFPLQL